MRGSVILSRDLLQLRELPAAGDVRLANTVPSATAELLRIGGPPGSVTTVILAGELLAPSLVREILGGGVVQRVFDLYGSTENTTYRIGCTANGLSARTKITL